MSVRLSAYINVEGKEEIRQEPTQSNNNSLLAEAAITVRGCPLGTRCSLSLRSPRCVPSSVVGGIGVAVGDLDFYDHSLPGRQGFVGGTFHRTRQCYPLNPICHATHYDRFNDCKYTFSQRQHRCIKIYVTNACAYYNSRRRNLFNSRRSCQLACSSSGRRY
ncbi:hypothetical protein PoB_003389600 [Plakobranchus ocellatus]|uniref:BPTI/Kunitz inhibitor domain-containing protein n=1 Tax=Plakobranchus ocellatus TaxID=259542 RepID=A0AAV4A847_9GAST|nr:hypothetical protein PoB_003389600 [Plakobranchus ocellatus]